MLSLMTLPRELRDKICIHALFAQTSEQPALNQPFEQLLNNRTIYARPRLQSWTNNAHSHLEDTICNATNILLRTSSSTYDLDVILLHEIVLLPTWTYVPFLSTRLEEVNATFRISGSYNEKNELPRRKKTEDDPPLGLYVRFGRYKGFRGGDGAGPAVGWQIYSILERFIRVGPTRICTEVDAHRHIVIRTLNINIETPPDVDVARFCHPRSGLGGWYRNTERDNDKDTLDPDYLASFIIGNISGLLSGVHHEWFEYGQILYEHVDEVVILKDGEKLETFDVANMLQAVVGQEKYLTQQRLDTYREFAWRVREERGLVVPAQ
ncbi:Nn.00g082220.m01.CDS01 [Neocucurbitaria sp. VM-36]